MIAEGLLAKVAERLRVLGQSVRLRLVEQLADGAATPQELADALGLSQQMCPNIFRSCIGLASSCGERTAHRVGSLVDGRPNPAHLERAAYLALGVAAVRATARRNGASRIAVSFPAADPLAPTRIRVAVDDPIEVKGAGSVRPAVAAEAELAPPVSAVAPGTGQGEYRGPEATPRDGSSTNAWASVSASSGRPGRTATSREASLGSIARKLQS